MAIWLPIYQSGAQLPSYAYYLVEKNEDSAARHRNSNIIVIPARAVIPLGSYGGDTSTASPPMMFNPLTPLNTYKASNVVIPPATGVPVRAQMPDQGSQCRKKCRLGHRPSSFSNRIPPFPAHFVGLIIMNDLHTTLVGELP